MKDSSHFRKKKYVVGISILTTVFITITIIIACHWCGFSKYAQEIVALAGIDKYKSQIELADLIFIEYGSNDVSAIMCGFTTFQTAIVSFVKALDGIRQLNPKVEIKFLTISLDHKIIYKHSKLQCDYLSNEYFKGFDFKFPVGKCCDLYCIYVF